MGKKKEKTFKFIVDELDGVEGYYKFYQVKHAGVVVFTTPNDIEAKTNALSLWRGGQSDISVETKHRDSEGNIHSPKWREKVVTISR